MKLEVESSVHSGGSVWTAKLSNEPRALSDPAPTKPLLSGTGSPLRSRAANVWVKACRPFAETVTVVPLMATSTSYQVSDLTEPRTGDWATTCQPVVSW